MKFSNEYFEDEVREGFYIPGMIKRSWAEQLSVLETVDAICAKYGLRWFADYGTLIGAVRHRGFIPWDDDLDICMLREDFEKLRSVMDAELPEEYHILDFEHEDTYDNFLLRITNNSRIDYSQKYLSTHNGFPFVAGIDIFPIDYVYPDEAMEEDRVNRAKALFELAKKEANHVKKTDILKKLDAIFAEYDGKDADGNLVATEVASMYFWCQYANHKYPKRFYDHIIKLPFENGTTINAPAGFMEMMHLNYGDWWRINRHGGIHDYPFYTTQEESMLEAFNGRLPYRYTYSESDLESSFEDKDTYKSEFAANSEQIIETIKSALQILTQTISNNDIENATQLLASIQDLSVRLGNDIESLKGEGFVTVSIAEEFCEELYKLYSLLNTTSEMIAMNAVDMEPVTGVMSTYDDTCISVKTQIENILSKLEELEDSFNYDVLGKGDILFLPYDGRLWEFFEPIYRETVHKTDDNASVRSGVYVIPLNKYIKDFNGSLHDPVNDWSAYPDDIMLTNANDYDFTNRHPKRIYIQCPYDQYNSAISVHPFFYASNLNKRTTELVYTPCFDIDDIDRNDGKSMANTKYYINTPGVIFADKVLVKNDSLRTLYIDMLTEMVGESSRAIWEDKININIHYVNRDDQCDIDNNNAKKNMLFFTSFSEFYRDEGQMLDKLKSVFNTFKENYDKINIIWVLEDNFENNIKNLCPEKYENFMEMVSFFEKENLGIITDTNDASSISMADAYYGDGGYIMNSCVRRHIPVMVMNSDLLT